MKWRFAATGREGNRGRPVRGAGATRSCYTTDGAGETRYPREVAGLAACRELWMLEVGGRAMYPETRTVIARVGIGVALWMGVFGCIATFVPGAEAGWFGIAAAGAAIGLLSPNWRTRAVAGVLVIWLAWSAWQGYQHGQRYQAWLLQQKDLHPLKGSQGKE